MNYDIFSPLGYASVGLWVSMPVLWLLHGLIRPRRWLCHLALIAGIAAMVLATINSKDYVNRIQEDKSEQIAAEKTALEEARKRKEKERAEDVANVRFMEDDRGDFLDKGGMDDGDRAYYDDDTPSWKREKKQREQGTADTGLEGAIGPVEEKSGVNVSDEKAVEKAPIIMSATDYAMANRLDGVNLKVIRTLLAVCILVLLIDYISRFNSYREAYFPLPLPSSWANLFRSVPAVQDRQPKPRRSLIKELKVMSKRGDTFIYLSDTPEHVEKIPQKLPCLPFKLCSREVLPVDFDGEPLSADFVFDALWYGRCSFTVDSADQVDSLLPRFVELLAERKTNRARASQVVHLVWDMNEPVPDQLKENIEILGTHTGFSLFICN